jgi:hypothetical protein
MKSSLKKGLFHCFVMGWGIFFSSQNGLAEAPVGPFEIAERFDFFEIQGEIMEIQPEKNYLVVVEREIDIVNDRRGQQRLVTMLRNADGKTITFASLKPGTYVFVRGFEQTDGRIRAREIYKLPGLVTGKDRKDYPFFEEVPSWEPVRIKNDR